LILTYNLHLRLSRFVFKERTYDLDDAYYMSHPIYSPAFDRPNIRWYNWLWGKILFIKLILFGLMETQCVVPHILNLGTRQRGGQLYSPVLWKTRQDININIWQYSVSFRHNRFFILLLRQACRNPWCPVAWATVAPNTSYCRTSLWSLFHVTVLTAKILWWFLGF